MTNLKEIFGAGFSSFLERKRLKITELSNTLKMSHSTVSCWKIKKAFPDFTKIAALFEMGMTLQEMFGEDLGNKIIENSIGLYGNDETKTLFNEIKEIKALVNKQNGNIKTFIEIARNIASQGNDHKTQELLKDLLKEYNI